MAQCSTPRTAGLHATVFLDVPGGWSLKGLTRLRDERHQDREGTDGETDEQGTDQEPPPGASVGVPLSGKPVAEGSIVRILHRAPDSFSRGDYALVPERTRMFPDQGEAAISGSIDTGTRRAGRASRPAMSALRRRWMPSMITGRPCRSVK